jgi:hypothetical protein
MSVPIDQRALEALRKKKEAMATFDVVANVEELEALKAELPDGAERQSLDAVILGRKREIKASLEVRERIADLVDKAALPLAAAAPVFMTVLASEQLISGPVRSALLISAYVVGAAAWFACRLLAFYYSQSARRQLAILGKVD